jgi:hypothetical protein
MIQDIVLSPILIFLMFFVVLVMVTRWANSRREMPAYILGWMIGIFIIIIYQSVTSGASTPQEAEIVERELSLPSLLIPSALGLMAGLGASAIYGYVVRTHARRSVAVAIITASLVTTLFLIVTVSDHDARVFGVFALAFGIGVLGTFVVGGGANPVAATTRQDVNRQTGVHRQVLDDDLVPRPPDNFQASSQRAPQQQEPPVEGAEVSRSRLDEIRSRFD